MLIALLKSRGYRIAVSDDARIKGDCDFVAPQVHHVRQVSDDARIKGDCDV
jgi:histidinol phosphatase-like PHP family hydrolase